jgi:hypothetical protein
MNYKLSITSLLAVLMVKTGAIAIANANDREYLAAIIGEKPTKLIPTGLLKVALKRNDDFFQVRQLSNNLLLFLQRTPSNPQPLGRCDSGTEDFIVLISVDKKRATITDRSILQSCINNVDIGTEDPADAAGLVNGISVDEKEQTIRFTTFKYIDGEEQQKEIFFGIEGKKFVGRR